MLSATERTLRARVAAYSLHSQRDSRALTKNARVAFNQKFLDQVDPERTLAQGERDRRAAAARKAHFTRLALKSAQARRRRSQRETGGAK